MDFFLIFKFPTFLLLQKGFQKELVASAVGGLSTRSASWQVHHGKETPGVLPHLEKVEFGHVKLLPRAIKFLRIASATADQMTSTFPDALSHESFTPGSAR